MKAKWIRSRIENNLWSLACSIQVNETRVIIAELRQYGVRCAATIHIGEPTDYFFCADDIEEAKANVQEYLASFVSEIGQAIATHHRIIADSLPPHPQPA